MAPKVLISADTGIYTNPEGFKIPTLYQTQAYFDAIALVGGVPIFGGYTVSLAAEYADFCDCLLLSGGADIAPAVYGQQDRGSLGCDARRDAFELKVLEEFRKRGKPVLGICRGHQLINVALGGRLVQDIKNGMGIDHPRSVDHAIQLTGGRILDIFGEHAMVNSTHHQAVTPGNLAPGIVVTATSVDGAIIEGCEYGDKIVTVQFHPERYIQKDGRMLEIFRWLVNAALISD